MTARPYKFAVWLGGLALLSAALIDTVSVVARNFMGSIHGSIELIQLAVLIAGAVGLVIAVTNGTYARVHLLTERLAPSGKRWMDRFASALVSLFFLCILAGSVWIAADLWNGQEMSEVVGVPWRWLRLFANLCFFVAILVLLRHCWRPRR